VRDAEKADLTRHNNQKKSRSLVTTLISRSYQGAGQRPLARLGLLGATECSFSRTLNGCADLPQAAP
jgi:hypothetical protein